MVNSKTFYLNGGKTFSNLKSLAKELKDMSEDIYNHHVNPTKNDFENWVKDSIKNHKLSEKIKGHIGKIEMELEILRHLVFEDKKIPQKIPKKAEVKVSKPKTKKKVVKK